MGFFTLELYILLMYTASTHILDRMRKRPIKSTIVVTSISVSIGVIIFQKCQAKYAHPITAAIHTYMVNFKGRLV